MGNAMWFELKMKAVESTLAETDEAIKAFTGVLATLEKDFTPKENGELSDEQIAKLPKVLGAHANFLRKCSCQFLQEEIMSAVEIIRVTCTLEQPIKETHAWFESMLRALKGARERVVARYC